MTALSCDVCGTNESVGVASVPGVAMSVAYCQGCLRANAHPYGVLVANTATLGSYDEAAEWWREMIDDTCRHLGKTREQFDLDVAMTARDSDREYKRYIEESGHPEPVEVGPNDPF